MVNRRAWLRHCVWQFLLSWMEEGKADACCHLLLIESEMSLPVECDHPSYFGIY